MKKKVLTSLLIILVIAIFPLFMSGCKEPVHTVDEIDTLYTSLKTDKTTSQFFSTDMLVVHFDGGKVNVNNATDKSYIFGAVYKYYLASSSRLFSGVVNRTGGKPSFVMRNFQGNEITDLYNKLENVKYAMQNFAESKTVYEESRGNLYYKDTMASYNNLINSLYSFNTSFGEYYFKSIGKTDFSSATLNNANVRDMLSYELMLASKVSFNYEVVPFKINNPLGPITNWYNSTTQVDSFITLANACLQRLDSNNDLTPTGSNETLVKTLFTNIQQNAKKYNNEYEYFEKALQDFDVKAYTSATDKEAYLETRSAKERSSCNICQYFLNGRYFALTKCLTQVASSLRTS